MDGVKTAERIAGLQSIEKAARLLYMSLSVCLFSIRWVCLSKNLDGIAQMCADIAGLSICILKFR